MLAQKMDIVIWRRKKFDLLGFELEDEAPDLFEPRNHGLEPSITSASCKRGFVCTYAIRRNALYLKELDISDENSRRPPIGDSFDYTKLNLPLTPTGAMLLGAGIRQHHRVGIGFQKASSYDTVWYVQFKEGRITYFKNISEDIEYMAGAYYNSFNEWEVADRVEVSFNRDLRLR